MRELSDKEFVNDMRIFWRNIDTANKALFRRELRNYFDSENRAEQIINKML